jgi:hypothetical protein
MQLTKQYVAIIITNQQVSLLGKLNYAIIPKISGIFDNFAAQIK